MDSKQTEQTEEYDPAEPFDFLIYLTLLDDISNDLAEMNKIWVFTRMCRETTKVFCELGGIMKKAFEDIHQKCNRIKRNYNQHKEIHAGLITFILLEKDMDIAGLNGENGDFLIGTKMDSYKEYESTARTVLRLMWFLDFTFSLLKGLVTDKKRSLSSICSESYSTAFSAHHPTHIWVAVKAGMLLVPNREQIIEVFFHDKNYPQAYEHMELASNRIHQIKTRLWDLYKAQNLDNLP